MGKLTQLVNDGASSARYLVASRLGTLLVAVIVATILCGSCAPQPARAAEMATFNAAGGVIVLSDAIPCGNPPMAMFAAQAVASDGDSLKACWFERLGVVYLHWEDGDITVILRNKFIPVHAKSEKPEPEPPQVGRVKPLSI